MVDSNSYKTVVICGPTATGKTSLGLKLCKKYNGEVVSVDSRQVYKEMSIGTGKLPLSRNPKSKIPSSKKITEDRGTSSRHSGVPTSRDDSHLSGDLPPVRRRGGERQESRPEGTLSGPEGPDGNSYRGQGEDTRIEKKEGYWIINGIKIHLYDLISPDEELNAVQYARLAADRVERIWSRGKTPFLVGGAGLYLEILLGMVDVAKVPKNPELRERLGKLSQEELVEKLEEVDPERVRTIDKNSPHRVMRAIEIALGRKSANENLPQSASPAAAGKSSGSSAQQGTVEVLPEDIEPLWIGLNAPRKYLYDKIDRRVGKMVGAGLLDEVKSLVEKYGWDAPALDSIGYIEFKKYFEGEKELEEQIQRVKYNSHAYARRQLTWFRRNENINWLDITDKDFEHKAEKMVELYLEN